MIKLGNMSPHSIVICKRLC